MNAHSLRDRGERREVARPVPASLNRCIVQLHDAWHDVENAEGRDEATAAYAAWWQARTELREAMA